MSNVGSGSRHAHTTSFIREAIVDELVSHGHASLTMESIARRSYSSIGSVYARYPNRTIAMLDVLDCTVLPGLAIARTSSTWEVAVGRMLSDGHTRRLLCALVELALCSRHEPGLKKAGSALAAVINDCVPTLSADELTDDGLRWLVCCVLVGHLVLSSVGCTMPSIDASLFALVEKASITQPQRAALHALGDVTISQPRSPEPCRTDEVSEDLAVAVTFELAEHGASRANIRRIARRIGVTTGAVYRRFNSKNDLVREALVRELGPHRYAWNNKLAESVTPGSTDTSPGDVLADQMFALISDRTRLLSTLEMIHAARADRDVRLTLVSQFQDAATARAAFFEALGSDKTGINAEAMGWIIQLAPTGARVLVAMGDEPAEAPVRAALRQVMLAAQGR